MKKNVITVWEQDWYSKGYKKNTQDIYWKDEYEDFLSKMVFIDKLDEGMKVFVKDANIPIRSLNKLNVKTVTKQEMSDVTVLRRKEILPTTSIFWYKFYKCSDGNWTRADNHPNIIKGEERDGAFNWHISDSLEKITEMKGPFFDPGNLSFGKNEMSDEQALKIHDMLHSKDENMRILGLKLLVNYDIEKSGHRIATILDNPPPSNNKDIKFFLDNLLDKYPQHRMKNLEYWISMMEEYPDDKIIIKGFSEFIEKTTYKKGLYKIIKIE